MFRRRPVSEPSRGQQTNAEPEPDPRLELLQSSYKEVLDATKHQDDKVGRLLTATAFLTAAALALANLVGGRALPRPFTLRGENLPPLAIIALGVFLICVVFVVVMLISSISTPLKIPGFADAPDNTTPRRFSQIYFYSITDASRAEWKEKWRQENSSELQQELIDMYVRETQNLAVRTDFKYSRTSEGVALFTFGLLAFAAAIVFVFDASVTPCDPAEPSGATTSQCLTPVELTPVYLYALAAIVALWTFATLITQLRYGRLYVHELVPIFPPIGGTVEWRRWVRAWAGRLFAVSVSVASALMIVRPVMGSSTMARQLIVGLLVVALVCLLVTYVRRRHVRDGQTWVRWTTHLNFFMQFSALAISVVFTLRAWDGGHYGESLIAGFVFPTGIMLATLAGPTAQTAERRSRFARSTSRASG